MCSCLSAISMRLIILVVVLSMVYTSIVGRDFKSFEEFLSVSKHGIESTSLSSKPKIAPSEENRSSHLWRISPFMALTLLVFIFRLIHKLANNNWRLKLSWFYCKLPGTYKQRYEEKQEHELAIRQLVSWVAAMQDVDVDVDEPYEHTYMESNV